MKSELKLFLDDIKPAVLISKKQYKSNEDKLKPFNIKQHGHDYLIYRDDVDITQPLGIILGYCPKCVNLFMERKHSNELTEPKNYLESTFINYNGINFNCYDSFDEALEWCHQQYGQKMINTYGKIRVCNYDGGY